MSADDALFAEQASTSLYVRADGGRDSERYALSLARALLASAGLNRQGERGHSRAIFAAQPATYCLREQMYIAGTLVSALAVA